MGCSHAAYLHYKKWPICYNLITVPKILGLRKGNTNLQLLYVHIWNMYKFAKYVQICYMYKFATSIRTCTIVHVERTRFFNFYQTFIILINSASSQKTVDSTLNALMHWALVWNRQEAYGHDWRFAQERYVLTWKEELKLRHFRNFKLNLIKFWKKKSEEKLKELRVSLPGTCRMVAHCIRSSLIPNLGQPGRVKNHSDWRHDR